MLTDAVVLRGDKALLRVGGRGERARLGFDPPQTLENRENSVKSA